ncbi:LptA/OstA family protein [Klebsiella aerogenes]|nr:LptA/OstA family protein [Klebsiella aerogenes]
MIKMKSFILIMLLLSGSGVYAADNLLSAAYTIKSDTQVLLPNGDVQAFGDVLITSGEMAIQAEEAVFHRNDPANLFITASGDPIKYKGVLEDGRPFTGHSLKLKYVIKSGDVNLINKAFIKLQNSSLSASVITYNIKTKEMEALSSDSRIVAATLYPSELSAKK